MVNMQKSYHRSLDAFPYKLFRLAASFHIFQILILHSIWWIWKAWYWISYKSWILFRWTHNFSMVNMQKSYHRSFESFPYKIVRLTASFHIFQMLSLHSIWWIWKAWYWISYKSWILFRWTHNFSMFNMQKNYHRSFESFPYKILRLTDSFHIFQMLSLHSIWWIWQAWYWISYKSWILFRWTRNFSMVNMQKSYHRSFESFPYNIFRLTASFHIFQMLSLHSIWWNWKAWYWISYKSWILFRWTHNFSMVNMQKSYHRSFESFPYKIFRLTASFRIFQMLSLHSISWIWKAWYWISFTSWILFRWTHNFSMVNMQKNYHRSFESFPYKIFRLTASFHIFQMLSLHSIWRIWKAWYWISYKSWILFRWTHNFSMVNMQKSYHRSFESFPYKIFRLTSSFHIFQMLSLLSIWWIWKAWYWISYKSWILFRWTHNFSMVNMQKSFHRSFESFPYKIFRLTASFHIFQILSLHSIWWIWKAWYWISYKSWILFRWTHNFSMVNMQQSYHRSFESFPLQNLPAYCFVPHLPDAEPALDLADMKGLVLNQLQVMDFVQMDPQLFNG